MRKTSTPKVLVTLDSMKDINRGYYVFGKGLGDALIDENNDRFDLTYYLFRKTPYLFNGKVSILFLNRLHRFFFPYKNKYNLFHFSDQNCRLRPYRVNGKKIITIHDLNKVHLKNSKPWRIEAYLKKLKQKIDSCDRVVTISKFVASDVLKFFPDVKEKIRVIYNGVDELKVPENHVPQFMPANPFLFTIGLLSVQKGFHLLPPLLQSNNLHLVISGIETPHKERILMEADKYGCKERVHITGPVTDADKAWYYQHCEAFVFPSKTEGFGLPIIEAMQFGKPVFLSTFTSLPEIGSDKAYYFDNFDPLHMQEILNRGLKDFAERQRAKEMQDYAKKFTWQKAAKAYLALYEECLNSDN